MKRNICLNEFDEFFKYLLSDGYNFFTGVPGSILKQVIKEIENTLFPNVVAVHESQAMGIAVGAFLAGKA